MQHRVQLGIIVDAQPGREVALARELHLVLDLTLLPARSGRARRRLDQMMRTHPLEAGVEAPLLADQDRIDRRRHVVMDSTHARAAKMSERLIMGVEHHLLALTWIGDQERHAAVAKPEMRDLDLGRHPTDHHKPVAPVELAGLTRREPQRNKGVRQPCRSRLPPALRVAPHAVVAALVALAPQIVQKSASAETAPASISSRSSPASPQGDRRTLRASETVASASRS